MHIIRARGSHSHLQRPNVVHGEVPCAHPARDPAECTAPRRVARQGEALHAARLRRARVNGCARGFQAYASEPLNRESMKHSWVQRVCASLWLSTCDGLGLTHRGQTGNASWAVHIPSAFGYGVPRTRRRAPNRPPSAGTAPAEKSREPSTEESKARGRKRERNELREATPGSGGETGAGAARASAEGAGLRLDDEVGARTRARAPAHVACACVNLTLYMVLGIRIARCRRVRARSRPAAGVGAGATCTTGSRPHFASGRGCACGFSATAPITTGRRCTRTP
jgi:hypothetical protein